MTTCNCNLTVLATILCAYFYIQSYIIIVAFCIPVTVSRPFRTKHAPTLVSYLLRQHNTVIVDFVMNSAGNGVSVDPSMQALNDSCHSFDGQIDVASKNNDGITNDDLMYHEDSLRIGISDDEVITGVGELASISRDYDLNSSHCK